MLEAPALEPALASVTLVFFQMVASQANGQPRRDEHRLKPTLTIVTLALSRMVAGHAHGLAR